MDTYLNTRWGDSSTNPSNKELVVALDELATPDSEHPDCWLSDEEGWTVAFHENGKAVLENVETGEGPWHMKKVSKDQALTLWSLLMAQDLVAIKSETWDEGYGDDS